MTLLKPLVISPLASLSILHGVLFVNTPSACAGLNVPARCAVRVEDNSEPLPINVNLNIIIIIINDVTAYATLSR
jgi:hypothetical protein